MNDNFHIKSYFNENLFDLKVHNKKLHFKFVILRNHEVLNFVYGPIDIFPYHANLVNKFCEDNQIPSAWTKKPDFVEIFEPDAQIRGGGWIELNNTDKLLSFYGYSTAYGKYKLSDLESIINCKRHFVDYKIEFN